MSEVLVTLCDACAPLLETCDTVGRLRAKACFGCRARITYFVARRKMLAEEPIEGRIAPFTLPDGVRRPP